MSYYTFECETCTREFNSQHAANQHMNALDHWAPTFDCETCDRIFFSQYAANQHMNDMGHWSPRFECETCNSEFYTQQSANQHMNRLNHWAMRYDCEACNQQFRTATGAKKHMDENNHWRQHYCHDCQRGFESDGHLKAVCGLFTMSIPSSGACAPMCIGPSSLIKAVKTHGGLALVDN